MFAKLNFHRREVMLVGLSALALILSGTLTYNHFYNSKPTISEKKENLPATEEKAKLAKVNGNLKEAILLYERILQNDPKNYQIKQELADVYSIDKHYDKALVLWEEINIHKPGDKNILNSLANIYRDMGKNDEAIESYKKSIELGNSKSISNLVTLYNLEERYDESVALLYNELKKYPDDSLLNQLLASTFYKKGELAKSKAILASMSKKR